MDLRRLTREQKMYAAAIACAVFVISLYLPWRGGADGVVVVPSYWIFLLAALVAGGLLATEALRLELPEGVAPVPIAALLTLFPLVETIAIAMDEAGGASRGGGLFIALIAGALAAGISFWLWRDVDEV